MRFFRDFSIKWKLTLLILLTSAFALGLAALTLFIYDAINYKRAEMQELSMLADLIGETCADALELGQPGKAEAVFSALDARRRIVAASLTDARGALFARYQSPDAPAPEDWSPGPGEDEDDMSSLFSGALRPLRISRRVGRNGQVLGRLTLHCRLQYLHARLPHYIQITGFIFGLTMICTLLLSMLLQRVISRPIRSVSRAAQSVSVGEDASLNLAYAGRDEIGELVESFNHMLAQIHVREEELRRHRGHLEELVDQRAAVIKHTNEELRKEIWERKRAQGALIRLNEELEDRINERTQALLDNVLELRKVSEALERERNLFTDGPVIVFKWRAEEGWPIEYVSSNIESWGYDSHLLMERQTLYNELVLEEDRGDVFGDVAPLQNLPFVERDYRIVTRQGEIKWVYSYTKPVHGSEDRVTHYDGYLLDITERRTIQQALHESEKRLSLALDATNDVLWDLDIASQALYLGKKWSDLFGYSPDETPTTIEQLIALAHPEDRENIRRLMAAHIEGRAPCYEAKYQVRMADGEFKWILDRGKVVAWNAERAPLRMVGTYTDITQQKDVEIEISLQRALLRSMINSIPDLIYYKDLEGVYMGCNPAFLEYVGKTWDEVVGRTDAELFEPEAARRFSELDALMLREKTARIDESWGHYPDGRRALLSTMRTPYYGPDGETLGVVGMSRDVTAHRQAEQELAEKQAQLIHSGRLAALGEMSTAIAHELGQPLQIIKTSAGIIEEELSSGHAVPDEIRPILGKIMTQVHRAATIIRNVRAFARQDETTVVTQAIDLKFPLEEALSFFREQFKQGRVVLDVEAEHDIPPARVSAQKFQQVIVNLLSNARYAVDKKDEAPPRGYHKHVSVRLYRREPAASSSAWNILEVADNGIGMNQEAIERCMDPFYTTKPVGEGTGLGLSILYGIVKDFGGDVEIESEPGEGSVFRILIPPAA